MSEVDSRQAVHTQTKRGMSYFRSGHGRPVVCVHGWCLNGRMWGLSEGWLPDGHEALVPDLPGFGQSKEASGPFTVSAHADAVGELLEEELLTDAVLVGFAYGGAVSLAAAAASPELVGGVIVMGVPTPGVLPTERMVASMRRDWPGYARRSSEALTANSQLEGMKFYEDMFLDNRVSVATESWQSISNHDCLPVAASVGVPTLFIHGHDDDYSPASTAEECANSAGGHAVILEGSRHLVILDRQTACRELVTSFLSEVVSRS